MAVVEEGTGEVSQERLNVSQAVSSMTWASSGNTPCPVSGRRCVLNSQQNQTFQGLFLLELAQCCHGKRRSPADPFVNPLD